MNNLSGNGCDVLVPFNERKPLAEIERSLIKTYRKGIWSKFIKAIKQYDLIQENDKIAVAISGGKDSIVLAKLFQELKKHSDVHFELEFISMDPGYHPSIRELMEDNFKYLDLDVHIFETNIFEVADKIASDYPCYMCAKMRRGALYNKVDEMGCNKLALGHHYNDVIETTMLNLLYAGSFKTMLPKIKSSNYEGLELIRPLYLVEEVFIERFIQNSGIWPLNCACMVAAKKTGSKRHEMKDLIKNLKTNFKDVDKSIFKAASNVNMDCILGWQKDGATHSYLDFFE